MNPAQLLCDLGQVISLAFSFFTYKMWGKGTPGSARYLPEAFQPSHCKYVYLPLLQSCSEFS